MEGMKEVRCFESNHLRIYGLRSSTATASSSLGPSLGSLILSSLPVLHAFFCISFVDPDLLVLPSADTRSHEDTAVFTRHMSTAPIFSSLYHRDMYTTI